MPESQASQEPAAVVLAPVSRAVPSVCVPQLVCEAQAALSLAENVPELHSMQLLSAVLEPMVQTDPSAQEPASAFVQLAQFAVADPA